MSNFIQVIGESEYSEAPRTVIIDVTVSVRAAKDETALRESREAAQEVIRELVSNGIEERELFYGGADVFVPWWRKRKAGTETHQKITIRSERTNEVYKALEAMEKFVKEGKRTIIQVDERQPVFEAKPADVDAAWKAACSDARKKAEILAAALGRDVGKTVEIHELGKGTRASGNYGDWDWSGDSDRFAGPAAGDLSYLAEEEPIHLQRNTRTVFLKVGVKFKLK